MRICYFGAFDISYTRNNFIRRALELNDCHITYCNVPQSWPTYKKVLPLIQQYRKTWRDCDLIVVAEFCQTVVPLAWLLGQITGRPVIFDMVIGLYEASVLERGRYPVNSFAARKLYYVDKIAGMLSNKILTGTMAYKEYLVNEFGISPEKVQVTPLGVDDQLFFSKPKSETNTGRFVILYHGSYIPNHGVETIIKAAANLDGYPSFSFRLIGDGEGKANAMRLADQLGVENIEFLSKVPFQQLSDHIADADIVLGVFGDTSQARKAMANKVLEGLAMQKPVVTGDTISIRENFKHMEHLWLIPLADASALSESLILLSKDTKLMTRLAEVGYSRVIDRLIPIVVGKDLIDNLHRIIDNEK
jgi:glycosyltransferase involved in cell wall biosynthesis